MRVHAGSNVLASHTKPVHSVILLSCGIDGGYVRKWDKKKTHFEVIVGKSIPEEGASKCFGLVQSFDDKPKRRVFEVLNGQGMQLNQQIVFLSDGGDTVRNLQLYLNPEAEHLLDWFHVTMRLTVLRQIAKGLPMKVGDGDEMYELREPTLKMLESIKWYLWHGNSYEALQHLDTIDMDLDAAGEVGKDSTIHKLLRKVRGFQTYIANNQAFITNYGERYRQGDRISTAFVESTVNYVVAKRFTKRQQMQLEQEFGSTSRLSWSPRVARDFLTALQNTVKDDGSRKWSDRAINRMSAHLKTFAKWIHKHRPFPLGQPMEKIKMLSIGNQLEIERALTKQERNRILDAADQLLLVGGRSRDRHRNGGATPPQRKNYRPYRNRAIIYALIETGMRRNAITNLNLVDIDFDRRILSAVEKGGSVQPYPISKQGVTAISDYLEQERVGDQEKWQSHALFLSPATNPHGDGRLTPKVVNTVWNQDRDFAGVDKDKTPHSARHGMGVFIMEKTGNVAAVQRQLGHKNASFSLQYSRITNDELKQILDER